MERILIWGSGGFYSRYIGFLFLYCEMNDITIEAITTREQEINSIDGIPVIRRCDIRAIEFDHVVAMVSFDKYKEVCLEAVECGLNPECIIPIQAFLLYGFSIKRYEELRKSKISIFSNNCWGGLTYHRFGLEFYSPTINLSIGPEEKYIEMLAHLKEYMEGELEYSRTEINKVNNAEYPVAYIGDGVRVNLLHYASFEEGYNAWEKRKKRINYNNLFYMMYTEKREYAELFESLKVTKKICFVPFETDLPSAMTIFPYIKQEKNEKPFWEYVNQTGSGKLALYDPWELLMNGKKIFRMRFD